MLNKRTLLLSHHLFAGCLALAALGLAGAALAQPSFITFESGQVRPLALSPSGSRLLAVNTPDNRLEVFDVSGAGLSHANSIPVGMEPVAVAARNNDEVWVVNHLSDSVSIIDLSATPPQVVRTLLVGDEPRDIVFAGTGGNRAFITTAHRGQHRSHSSISGVTGAGDPQLTTEGIDRADVWVFDATNLGATIGGTPVKIQTFFSDTPRALAVSADGNTVYVAAFHSGNETTVINETVVPDGFGGSGVPGPSTNFALDPAPETGVIVKKSGGSWLDSSGTNWNSDVNFDLPDHDVFAINANTLAPGSIVEFDHVGTILFNMVVHPDPLNGKIYVTNTELPNHVDFEGPGVFGGSTVQGHLSESRITVIDPSGPSQDPQHLNPHIVYSELHTDGGANHALIDSRIPHSLATPLQPVISSDGNTLYVAAFGSAKIGVFSTSDLDDPSFETNYDPTTASANYIATGGGPSGLVLDETNNRLYVLTRFDNALAEINPTTKATLATHSLHNPEPQDVVDGRPFLYDATLTSGNGEASCSSCHIFADFDSLAWNLGNPDDTTSINNQPSATILPPATTFHPMKGPMTTQTLRGLATHGGMHWRGDRVDGFFGTDPCTEPTGAPCDEDLSFRNFIVAFEGLVGKNGTITPLEMQAFADFVLEIMLPPNPVQAIDNSLTADELAGQTLFNVPITDTVATCNGCHRLSRQQGFFGSGGEQSFEGEPQNFKIAHMRNLYAKVGMFGNSVGGPNTGDQVRGFGFLHDGSVDTVANFLTAPVFSLNPSEEAQLEQFALAFPSDLAPVVGQQVTRTASNGAAVDPRIDLMITRAGTSFTSFMLGGVVTECDLVVKGSVGGQPRGWLRESGGLFRDDQNNTIADAALRALAGTEGPLTYTCAPPGSGTRMGINRDEDSVLDGLDNCPAVANDDQADTDNDGLGDVCDTAADTDGDGVEDALDNCPSDGNPLQEDFDDDGLGDVCDPDDDDDGLADDDELLLGTDPFDADSDDDGFSDGQEVAAGSNPLNPDSTPLSNVPALPFAVRALLTALMLGSAWLTLRRRSSAA
jgi:DNA-binding beta-propeller fold protein YncE